jgi:hypothetical protein
MSWRDYSFSVGVKPHGLQSGSSSQERKKVVRLRISGATRRCISSFGINGATSLPQAGLEKHQSSVKRPNVLSRFA